MKKVKLTVNENSAGKELLLFGSPESAYVWLSDAYDNPDIVNSIEDVEKILILPGSFIEAEWIGCEFAFNGHEHMCISYVRLVLSKLSDDGIGNVYEAYSGWAHDCIIPFRNFTDEFIKSEVISEKESTIDLDRYFLDDEEEEPGTQDP